MFEFYVILSVKHFKQLINTKKILSNVSFSFEFEKSDTRYSELLKVNVKKVDLLMF